MIIHRTTVFSYKTMLSNEQLYLLIRYIISIYGMSHRIWDGRIKWREEKKGGRENTLREAKFKGQLMWDVFLYAVDISDYYCLIKKLFVQYPSRIEHGGTAKLNTGKSWAVREMPTIKRESRCEITSYKPHCKI